MFIQIVFTSVPTLCPFLQHLHTGTGPLHLICCIKYKWKSQELKNHTQTQHQYLCIRNFPSRKQHHFSLVSQRKLPILYKFSLLFKTVFSCAQKLPSSWRIGTRTERCWRWHNQLGLGKWWWYDSHTLDGNDYWTTQGNLPFLW